MPSPQSGDVRLDIVEIGLSKGRSYRRFQMCTENGGGGYHVVLQLGSWMVLDYSVPDDGSMLHLHAPDGFQPSYRYLQVLWQKSA